MIVRVFAALLLAAGVVVSSALPAFSQAAIVSDPKLEMTAAQEWQLDVKNATQFLTTANNSGKQLLQQMQQTQSLLAQAKTLEQQLVQGRNVQAEWTSLQNLAKVSQGVIAATGAASTAITKAFPGIAGANVASKMMIQYNQGMQGTLMSASQAMDARFTQMSSEEATLQNLRNQILNAQNSNLGTNQLLQLGLALSREQLDEQRSMERLMLEQFQAQQAYMYAHGSAETKEIIGQAAIESFFRPLASPTPGL